RLNCWVLFDFQVALGHGVGITLTRMTLNTCLSILPSVVELDPVCSTTLESPASGIQQPSAVGVLGAAHHDQLRAHLYGRLPGRAYLTSNSTILIHKLQMILYLLPLVPIITRLKHNMAATVAHFMVFLVSQALSPVMYGLRCRELQEQLPHFLPRWTKVCQACGGQSSTTDCSSTGTSNSSRTTLSTGNKMSSRTTTRP
ncbi:unnamed protein product, partial [Coregonus sp. 'balchen']